MATQSTQKQNAPAIAVRQYIEAFNRGDAAGMGACFAESGAILDGMAPHLWQGASAASDWYSDVLTEGAHVGASDYFVTLEAPLHDVVTGDAAYFVAPAKMTFKVGGQQVMQVGATFTVALRLVGDDWRIAAWAWSKGRPAI